MQYGTGSIRGGCLSSLWHSPFHFRGRDVFQPRSHITIRRCRERFLESLGKPRKSPKRLKSYTAFSIPAEVNEDLNAYLDNISNRKALKRFSHAAVRAWFLSRGYDKQ